MKISNLIKSSIFTLLIAGASISNVIAQSDRSVSVKNFKGVTVSSGIDLYLTQGNTEALTIKGDRDLIKDVIVEQENGNVRIRYKEGVNWGRLFKNQSIKVYVNYKTLTSLTASGGSDVYTQNNLKSASGGSDLKLSLTVRDLTVTVSGGSDVDLKGSGENLQLTASGGSDVNAFSYVVNNAKATVSGGSDANIYVNKALEASASGGSDVNYKGNASVRKTSSSKSGDVNRVN
jgi:hypothetical protein